MSRLSAPASTAMHRPSFRFATALVLCLGLAPMACAQRNDDAPPTAAAPQPAAPAAVRPSDVVLPSFATVVRRVLPAVVNITALHTSPPSEEEGGDTGPDFDEGSPSPLDEFLRRFFGQEGQPGAAEPGARVTAAGSGFIIDPAGYIVTDAHVVADAQRVTVTLQDDSRYRARIVGMDDVSDLALLKIDGTRPFVSVPWGDSDTAQVGDWILAVGNPFGLGGTVSAGILSARGREINASPYTDFLQIDAPLNRGNSGGPTFNIAGEVIGINTAIYTPSGGSVGIGFAIPANLAKPVIEQLKAHGKVIRGWLGVEIQPLTPMLARSFGLAKPAGALVANVTPGGPADKAGIRQGDIIVAFNGQALSRSRDLSLHVAEALVGAKANVTVWREGRNLVLTPVIIERPPQPAPEAPVERPETPKATTSMGLRLSPLTPDLRHELGLAATVSGVVVLDIAQDSPLADSGLQRGDVIMEIDRSPVGTPQAAAARLQQALSHPDQTVLLLVNRDGKTQYLAFSLNAGNDLDEGE